MLSDIVKEKLDILISKLDKGTVHEVVQKSFSTRTSVMGDKATTLMLPTLKGTINNIKLDLDFVPFPGGGFLMDIQLYSRFPFRGNVTLNKSETKCNKYQSSGLIPLQAVKSGIKDFDECYYIEANVEEPVKNFIKAEKAYHLIKALEKFDRLTFRDKYLRLTYFVEEPDKIEVNWMYEKINVLLDIIKVINQ